jgi:phenylacetic acid degradation operon negative regulatory protein
MDLSDLAYDVRHHEPMTLKPRSLVLDMYGEYLRYLGSEVRMAHLTSLLGEFGVAPATVRVTMSRLRTRGWFTSQREGRETVYRLSQTMLDVLDDGRTRIFAPPARDWSGWWTMVMYQIAEDDRQERNQLRKTLAWHGFGPLGASTWLAPGDRRAEARAFVSEHVGDQVDVLVCRSEGIEHDRSLARRCWELEALARDYSQFTADHAELVDLAPRLRGAEALTARTELISTFRHFPFRDPRLPLELRPTPWPGDRAHELFRHVYETLGPAAREHVGSIIGRDVPAPSAEGSAA